MNKDWLFLSAADLGRAIGAGEIDAEALTETFLTAIETHALSSRIYARVTPDRARAGARAAAARAHSGQRLSPLDGVPISWKDLFDTAGIGTEAGSKLLKDRVPDQDAEVFQNATMAGLVCLGKTHMSELAFSGLGYNPSTQTPPSVNFPNSVAGGSSSGAAASVAFGLAAAAVGSDTGGSVRIPSAWNDLVGLKTTSGRLPLKGVVPLVASFDTVGPLCRTVEDASLMLAALQGCKPADLAGASLKNTRLLLLESIAMDQIRPEPLAGFEAAVERLQNAGAKIERCTVDGVEEALSLSGSLFTPEAYATWQDEIEANPEKMYGAIRSRFETGKDFSGVQVIRAWQRLKEIRTQWEQQTAGYDAVILPTSPTLPPDIERLASDEEFYVVENLLALRNTRIGNLMDLAAITLPTGIPSAGISMMTPPNTEERLLRLSASAMAALA